MLEGYFLFQIHICVEFQNKKSIRENNKTN